MRGRATGDGRCSTSRFCSATSLPYGADDSETTTVEDPEAILRDILEGIPDRSNVTVEVDRRKAIELALGTAGPGDLVVIAGKGHEQGQEFENGRKLPFDDRDVAREGLRALGAGAR